jgi:hypothetical protein
MTGAPRASGPQIRGVYDRNSGETSSRAGETSGRTGDAPRQDKSLTALLSDLASETTTLVRKEVELAKAEMSQKVGEAVTGVVALAGGALVAFAGLIYLLLAAVYGLTRVIPDWAAALAVGGGVLIVGLIMVLLGKSKLSAANLQPKRTLDTLQEDKRWAKSQLGR